MKKIILALTAVCTLSLAARMADKPLLKVFDAAYRQEPYKNVLLSPWGIQECFGMIYGGAGKVSAAELTRTLGIDAALGSELRQARELLKQSFPKFNSFNAILFDRKYTLQKNFTNYAGKQYNGKLFSVDFARKKEAADMLNGIIKRESSGMFDKVFNEKILSSDPAMVLLNVLYFQGRWALPFEKHLTKKEKFYAPSKSKFEKFHHSLVDMMNDERFIPYYNDGTVHGITLRYRGAGSSDVNMLVLTGVKSDTPLHVVTKSLADKGVMHFVNHSSSEHKTVVKLPELKLEGEVDLKKLFTALGMKTMFDPRTGDLTGMTEKRTLYIDRAKQLLKLKLDENGSEMSAVTYAMPKALALPPRIVKKNRFYADHPFVLVLFDRQSGALLLTAAVVKP